jgi:hypothetical protein
MLHLTKYLIQRNSSLVEQTAIKDCHIAGLNSFIINERPKIRLFTVEPHCKLYDEFNPREPLIPIHPHKYDDVFIQLYGTLTHQIYKKGGMVKFPSWEYLRIGDKDRTIKFVDDQKLLYVGSFDCLPVLRSDVLHTVSIKSPKMVGCYWLIVETFEDPNFKQVAYHPHPDIEEFETLYKPMEDPLLYLKNYFK